MLVIKTPYILHQVIKQWRQTKNSIALIPTMGNLHEGHMILVDTGKKYASKIIVSIFVNPTQFDRLEDLFSYPRTLKKDCEQLIKRQVDAVFIPKNQVIYPSNLEKQTFVDVLRFTNMLEGKSRIGHFRGVATIVSKLFNLVQPDFACFGEKDFQQLLLVRQLVQDMHYNIDVISVPTVRSDDGLAFSSRNNCLSTKERSIAPYLNRVITKIADLIKSGTHNVDDLLSLATAWLLQFGLVPDILAIRDSKTLESLTVDSRQAVILFSVWLGKTRLLDNAIVDLTYPISNRLM